MSLCRDASVKHSPMLPVPSANWCSMFVSHFNLSLQTAVWERSQEERAGH